MLRNTQHISNHVNSILDALPEEQRKKILVDRKIKQVHQQFSACVDPFILDHVNSVYLIKENAGKKEQEDVSRETRTVLTVYVDNSLIAAELNAQRELIVLKYRELFSLKIDKFLIKISHGAYRENYPFKEIKKAQQRKKIHRLTPEEEEEIKTQTSTISDQELRQSFERAVKATKEHPLED